MVRGGGCTRAGDLDHRTLRRYFSYLQTRGFSKASISRKAASVHAYVRFLRRRGGGARPVYIELTVTEADERSDAR